MSTSLRDKMMQMSDAKDDKNTDSNQNHNDDPQRQSKPRGKEDNLAALRIAKEEQEKILQSLQGENLSLKEKAAKLEDERFQKLLSKLDEEHEGDPDKFIETYQSLREATGGLEAKLKEKEEAIERISFERSEAYQKNVAGPIKSGEELLKGVIRKDEQLYKKLLKDFVYDRDGKVVNGSLTADEIIALDDILDESGESLKPERVKIAIENLREKFHEANSYYTNFKTKIQEEDAARQKREAEENAQQAGIAKIARAQAVRVGASQLLANEDLKAVLPEEFISSVPKVVLNSVESAIANRTTPSLEQMAQNQMKALIYDEIVKQGGLTLLRDAIGFQSEHSKGSEGTRGQSRPDQSKPSGSIIDMIAQKNGVDRRIRQ